MPESWKGKRVFLVVGASDWKTSGWLDGQPIGGYQGGYTPFELELTKAAKPGQDQRLVLRVDDTPHAFKLEGKQGYGKARGLWQTVYLEARPAVYVDSFEVHSSLAEKRVELRLRLSDPAPAGAVALLRVPPRRRALPRSRRGRRSRPARARRASRCRSAPARGCGRSRIRTSTSEALSLTTSSGEDRVKTYFGFREIGVAKLPGLGHPYVSLNGKPLYLQLTLDQGWHPDGFYTWPSDAAMREEVLIARRLGLNAIRTHVKVELPRKLYWADRLGVLVMSDVPNSWGEPDAAMRKEWETAFRGMLRRDFNHPSIFSWVLFNEQWGLLTPPTGREEGVPARDAGVGRDDLRPREGARPDAPRRGQLALLRDRRPRQDRPQHLAHVPAGWKWKEELDKAEAGTKPGSNWNYLGGRSQRGEPMLNSECGNVWGYEGSTGDVDWSFDYHAMLDEFRRHPKTAGWLYTEHHDVINEWNGYVRARPLGEGDGPGRAGARHVAPRSGTGRSTSRSAPIR